jgi:predicted transport protein
VIPRPDKLPIIVDNPTSSPGLGFDRYVQGIAAAALGGTPARYTIGLYGPWGSGKSSLLRAIEERVSVVSENDEFRPIMVRFDAWRYEKSEQLIFPLLHAVTDQIAAHQSRLGSAGTKMAATIKNLLGSLELSFLGVGLKYEKSAASDSGSYTSPFAGLSAVSTAIGTKRRIIVLIDDLDRCSPDGVVNVLEAIHVLTDVDGFVFVLALDYDYLTGAILKKYEGTDPHRYIEKIVQVPFHIPRPELNHEALTDIVPNWKTALRSPWFQGVNEGLLEEVIYLALRSNPRQVKRLINTFLLARFMNWDSPNSPQLVLRVLGLQLAWPADFRRLHDASASVAKSWDKFVAPVLSDVHLYTRVLSVGSDDADEKSSLTTYLEEILTGEILLSDLLPIMNLTENVAETERSSARSLEDSMTPFELSVQRASLELGELLDQLISFVENLGADVVRQSRQNFITFGRRKTEGTKPSYFVSLNLKTTKNRLLVFLTLDPQSYLKEGVARDVTDIGHHGNGNLEIALHPGQVADVEWTKQLIRQNYEEKGAD